MSASLQPVFLRLRSVLQEHQAGFSVSHDTAKRFGLEAPVGPATIKAWGGQAKALTMPVAWVEVQKSYVSYHLMGINPKLEAKLTDPLRSRMQGKSCFNFKTEDDQLFQELSKVTAESLLALRKAGFIASCP
jgi:hypothetical protein